MSEKRYRVTPVNGYDIPALEEWLEDQAAQGWLFSYTVGPLTVFDRTEEAPLRIHLEPAREKSEDSDPELDALYEQAGWRSLGPFRKNYLVYATEDPEAQAYTDPESQSYALGRFFRQKLLGGIGLLAANVLLLALYYNQVGWGWVDLRWFPVSSFASGQLLAFFLTVTGFFLLDLSWLLGLLHLQKYRKTVGEGRPAAPKGRSGGWLLAAAVVLLLPVALNTAQLFMGLDYRPYGIDQSNFLTLPEIQGDYSFPVTGDRMHNMNYVSHGGTLLEIEYWYWQQYGSFRQDDQEAFNRVPRIEYSIRRYPLASLAQAYMEEQSRINWDGSQPVGDFAPDIGFDAITAARGENRYGDSFTILLLRRGRLVMRVEYRGEENLLAFQPQLAAMLRALE